jgi:hypothetical protein
MRGSRRRGVEGAGGRIRITTINRVFSPTLKLVAARAVPEMKDLNDVKPFIDSIIDEDGSVHEYTDMTPPVHRAADVREALQQIDVVQDSLTESFGG